MSKKFIDTTEDGISKYLTEVRKRDTITLEKEIELAKRIKEGDQKAVDELVSANLRFVITVAKDYQNSGLPMADLISEGNYGLMTAAKRFDHTKGYRFISYAVWWIRQSILQSLNDNGRMVRLPANVINKISKNKKEVEKNTGDVFDDDFVQSIEKEYPMVVSLSSQMNEDGDELIDLIPDSSVKQPDDDVINDNDLKNQINNILSVLNSRERSIVECYFGLNGSKMTLEMIGEEYELTKERIRQIKDKAIRKLRCNSENLFEFLNN
jgi:RNA polymerase primary sigma factor